MNKTQLIDVIADKADLSKAQAKEGANKQVISSQADSLI
ncbi:DNA-binding protein, partial [Klebsiella pneumoniae]